MGINLGKVISNVKKEINNNVNYVKKEVVNNYNYVEKKVTNVKNELASYDYKKMASDGVKQIIVDPFKQAVKDAGGLGAAIGFSTDVAKNKNPVSAVKSTVVGWTAEVLVRTGINGLQGAHNYVNQDPKKYVTGQR